MLHIWPELANAGLTMLGYVALRRCYRLAKMFWIAAYGREVRLNKLCRYELSRGVGIFKRNWVGRVARFQYLTLSKTKICDFTFFIYDPFKAL